jgi:signal transduction histidine kinase/ActR/RegA family two-component response regulator
MCGTAGDRWGTAFERELREINEALLVSSVHQHELTEKAQRAEEQYRTLFNSIDEGFCVLEMLFDASGKPADYRFLEANPGFEKQTGLRDVTGKRVRELSSEHEAHWFEHYGHVALTGESIRFVGEANSLGGRLLDVYAFRLGAPELRRVAILCTDITERSRLEKKTQEQARSLAELNRRKDEFLAILSHELRNPLASILNAAHLLRLQRDRNPTQVKAQEMIDRQVAQLARLVDDLLEVSRISTGRIRLQTQRLDLRGIVQRAVETTRPQAQKKAQPLTQALPDEPLWVHGDAVRLEQVVVNLLNNASKYNDCGGQIWVTLQLEGDEAVLRVCDSGVGISAETLPHIFDLFTQADQSLDRAQGGLGVGLALVQSLVTLHGGRVEVHSTPGQGSEFIVRLPVLSSVQVSAAVRAENATARTVRTLKILVVDDNADVAQSTEMLLRALGHNIRVAHDGTRAMQVVLEFTPDVVLLDIGLPLVDGFQVARWIRRQPALRGTLLVALTGYGRESDRQRTAEAGFNYHLVKPVDVSRIESILANAARARWG